MFSNSFFSLNHLHKQKEKENSIANNDRRQNDFIFNFEYQAQKNHFEENSQHEHDKWLIVKTDGSKNDSGHACGKIES